MAKEEIVSPPSYGGVTAARKTRGRGKRKKGLRHVRYSPNRLREETENKKKCYRGLRVGKERPGEGAIQGEV